MKYYQCSYCGRIFKFKSTPNIPHNCNTGFRKHHLDFNELKVLHLVLAGKWYDMIASKEKKEEYREINNYWTKRLCNIDIQKSDGYKTKDYNITDIYKKYNAICFHRGYTNVTMLFELDRITIGKGNLYWGAPNHEAFILKLGERLR